MNRIRAKIVSGVAVAVVLPLLTVIYLYTLNYIDTFAQAWQIGLLAFFAILLLLTGTSVVLHAVQSCRPGAGDAAGKL
jgi:cobalamin biosynthesis protein CobD/CbiB